MKSFRWREGVQFEADPQRIGDEFDALLARGVPTGSELQRFAADPQMAFAPLLRGLTSPSEIMDRITEVASQLEFAPVSETRPAEMPGPLVTEFMGRLRDVKRRQSLDTAPKGQEVDLFCIEDDKGDVLLARWQDTPDPGWYTANSKVRHAISWMPIKIYSARC